MIDKNWIGIGINFKPNSAPFNKFVNLNEILVQKYKSKIILDENNNPHINLYDIDIPSRNIDAIISKLEKFVKNKEKFDVDLSKVKNFKFGIIYIECVNNPILQDTSNTIVDLINPLRENIKTEDYYQPWREYTNEQLVSLNLYGNPNVKSTFYPHITLGFVDPTLIENAVEETNINLDISTIKVDSIDLVIQNNSGKIVNRINFKFKKWN